MDNQSIEMRSLSILLLSGTLATTAAKTAYPTVTAHGMGDSCFNAGMKRKLVNMNTVVVP